MTDNKLDIKAIRKKLGLTQANFAKKIGVDTKTVQNWEYGRNIPASKNDLIHSIIEDSFSQIKKDKPQPDKDHKEYETYLLPMTAAGGSLVGFDSDGASAVDCEKIISPIADVSFAITIYGDSMYPTYPSGSRALIKIADPNIFIEWGTVYVLDTIDGIVIKELHKSKDPAKVVCHSINPKYDDFEINMTNIRGWYRVLACINIVHL